MGKQEDALLEYCNQNRRFAELANGLLFGGETYLKAEELTDVDRRQEHSSGRGRKRVRHRYRDISKEAKGLKIHLIIGAELQEHVDYVMPLRVMDMDVLGYLRQRKLIAGKLRQSGITLSRDEYLSRFRKDDRLTPEVTFVIYLGDEPWDGARSLHELLDFNQVPEQARQYVENYRLHILDVRHTSDEELRKFPSDIRLMLFFIKYTEDKTALANLQALTGCETIEEDTFEALAQYTNEPKLIEWKKKEGKEGEVNMCKGLRDLIADGMADGVAMTQLNLIQKKIQKGKSLSVIAEELEETEENIQKFYELIKKHPEDDVTKLLELWKKA